MSGQLHDHHPGGTAPPRGGAHRHGRPHCGRYISSGGGRRPGGELGHPRRRPRRGAAHPAWGPGLGPPICGGGAPPAGGEIEVTGADCRHLSTVTSVLSQAGCKVRSDDSRISLSCSGPLRGVSPVRTAPYPGFPTDAQAPLMAALATAAGTSVFVENIFESRYRHVDELARMGARIRVEGRVAVVFGVARLKAAAVRAADLRGGAALVVAALVAEGRSAISGLHHVDRGYQDLDGALRSLGADIIRREADA